MEMLEHNLKMNSSPQKVSNLKKKEMEEKQNRSESSRPTYV